MKVGRVGGVLEWQVAEFISDVMYQCFKAAGA
jgi:hypothetical protein